MINMPFATVLTAAQCLQLFCMLFLTLQYRYFLPIWEKRGSCVRSLFQYTLYLHINYQVT